MAKPQFVYHGSPYLFAVVRPQQARGANEKESQNAIYAAETIGNAFFAIDTPQSQNRGQIRTATHVPKPFENPPRSKFIYKAIDATAFWTDLNYHTIPLVETKVNPKKMLFPFG